MNRLKLVVPALILMGLTVLAGCKPQKAVDGAYDFVIYERDADNSKLSDNVVVARYHIEYKDCKTVTDTLIKKGDKYYFSESSPDYIVLVNGPYGLTYTDGYFENYSECSGGKAIDISYTYTAVNGDSASTGIEKTPLEGLTEFGFVINGWK